MSEFDHTPTEELRAQVNAYLRGETEKAAVQALPLPPAANRATLTPEQQETLFQNWVEHIYSRPPSSWTAEERAVIRAAISRAL